MVPIADTALGPIQIQTLIITILDKSLLGRYPTGAAQKEALDRFGVFPFDIPIFDGLPQCTAMNITGIQMEQIGPRQLGQNTNDAASPVHILDMRVLGCRSYLAQAGHLARKPI